MCVGVSRVCAGSPIASIACHNMGPVVCCGVVRCGVMWCGVVWCDVVWCDVVWCVVVWRDVVCCTNNNLVLHYLNCRLPSVKDQLVQN